MALGHEKLNVYPLAIGYLAWGFEDSVQDESPVYRIDLDSDSDFDPDGATSQRARAGQPATRPLDEPEGGAKPQPDAEGRSRQGGVPP